MSTLNPTHIDVIAKHSLEFSEFYVEWRCRCEDPEARWSGAGISVRPLHAAHVVSKLTDAGYRIMPSGDVELLRSIRWTVNGSAPMDLKDEYADGWNAAMRNIHRILHPAAATEGEKP